MGNSTPTEWLLSHLLALILNCNKKEEHILLNIKLDCLREAVTSATEERMPTTFEDVLAKVYLSQQDVLDKAFQRAWAKGAIEDKIQNAKALCSKGGQYRSGYDMSVIPLEAIREHEHLLRSGVLAPSEDFGWYNRNAGYGIYLDHLEFYRTWLTETVLQIEENTGMKIQQPTGYLIVDFDGSGMLEIQCDDRFGKFQDDREAVSQAIKDGIKVIPVNELPENFGQKYSGWVDTPENREAIAKHCKRKD